MVQECSTGGLRSTGGKVSDRLKLARVSSIICYQDRTERRQYAEGKIRSPVKGNQPSRRRDSAGALEAGRRGEERPSIHPQTSGESGEGDEKECQKSKTLFQTKEKATGSRLTKTAPAACQTASLGKDGSSERRVLRLMPWDETGYRW